MAELETELVTVRAVEAALSAKSPEMLWTEDLDGFMAAYEKFVGEKAASREEAASSSSEAAAPKKRTTKAAAVKKA